MPNVAGRSEACRTCRRRHVRCDAAKPHCARCIRSGLQCEGYQRGTTFIHHDLQASGPAWWVSPAVEHITRSNTTRQARSRSRNPTPPSSVNAVSDVPGHRQTPLYNRPSDSGSTLNDIQTSFIMRHLFNGMAEMFPVLAPIFRVRLETNDPSAIALKYFCFGRIHNHESSRVEGLYSYQRALRSLSQDLQDPNKVCTAETLLTASLLAVFEAVAGDSVYAWMQHGLGLARLMQFRRRESFQNDLDYALLRMSRFGICCSHMVNKKRCFLETPEWSNLVCPRDVEAPDMYSRLMDILATLLGLSLDVVTLGNERAAGQQETETFVALHRDLRLRIESMYEKLCTWRRQWEERYPNVSFQVSLPTREVGYNALYPTVLFYSNTQRAVEILVYNAILLIILSGARVSLGPTVAEELYISNFGVERARSEARRQSGTRNNSSSLAEGASMVVTNPLLLHPSTAPSARSIAIEIARSMSYLVRPEHSVYHALHVVFGLRVTQRFFAQAHEWGDSSTVAPENRQASDAWAAQMAKDLAANCGISWLNQSFDFCGAENAFQNIETQGGLGP